MSWEPDLLSDADPKGDAIGVFVSMLRAKVEAIVRQDFEGWNGTIRCRDLVLDVDLTLRKEN